MSNIFGEVTLETRAILKFGLWQVLRWFLNQSIWKKENIWITASFCTMLTDDRPFSQIVFCKYTCGETSKCGAGYCAHYESRYKSKHDIPSPRPLAMPRAYAHGLHERSLAFRSELKPNDISTRYLTPPSSV